MVDHDRNEMWFDLAEIHLNDSGGSSIPHRDPTSLQITTLLKNSAVVCSTDNTASDVIQEETRRQIEELCALQGIKAIFHDFLCDVNESKF